VRTEKESTEDYIDPRLREAPRKAAKILVKHHREWNSIIEAYWLLRRYEDEIGIPITYDIVEAAYEIAIRELRLTRRLRHAEMRLHEVSLSSDLSGKASTGNM